MTARPIHINGQTDEPRETINGYYLVVTIVLLDLFPFSSDLLQSRAGQIPPFLP
jgi:hypothetical protein